MRRADLSPEVQRTLKRLPAPYSNHYGVVPDPPPSSSPSVVPVAARHEAAIKALGRLEVLVSELQDPWLVSRVLARREAVSSSAVEGTHSTLYELLAVEETEDSDADRRTAAKQVRDYALCLDGAVPLACSRGPAVFTLGSRSLGTRAKSVRRGKELRGTDFGRVSMPRPGCRPPR
jgi:Fic/DOC family N-terminal